MIGNGFEFYFDWRTTFDVMINKSDISYLKNQPGLRTF